MEFPRALIAVSIGTALIPELTKHYSLEKISDFKNTASHYFAIFAFFDFALCFNFLDFC